MVNKYERLDIIKDCEKFLNIIKNLKLYLIEFKEDKSIKTNNYLDDCIIRRNIYCFIIIIISDEYIFFTNNEI